MEQGSAHPSGWGALLDGNTRWKNLVVRKDGTSSYGRLAWPTAEEAKKIADECDAEIRALYAQGELAYIVTLDGPVFLDDYSHTVQVPHP